jgi:phosphodiesterase/alkaline phosphatase D-like protein
MPEPDRPDHLLGPILRRVDGRRATVWVQTARAGTVEIVTNGEGSGSARTFSAYGRHYALVVVDGLAAATTTPYRVLVDGVPAWPPPDHPYPPPAIRTRGEGDPVRLVYGSCRQIVPRVTRRHLPDALDAYAVRLAAAVRADADHTDTGAADSATDAGAVEWPDSLVLLGDQVYADDTSPAIRGWLRRRRRRRRPDAPASEVVTFAEYVGLYLESWTDPDLRWLLSTVPSVMIFDDHEIIDDWNTSESWRHTYLAKPWWAERISAGLASYWVYQHLGNLSPDELAADPVYRAVNTADDATATLADFGTRADRDRTGYRWSFALDLGRTRLVVLDNRAGRDLTPGGRAMLADGEWRWFVERISGGGYDHLVLGSSLPWLMPPAVHHVEAMNERLCESSRPRVARAAERVRRVADLEHWAAFGRSFVTLADLLAQLGGGAEAPATISVLSGDVHHSYVARARTDPAVRSQIHQLTCSPIRNGLPGAMHIATRLAWSRGAARAALRLARLAGTPDPGLRWELAAGPFFDNAVSTLVHCGRDASVVVEGTDAAARLHPLATVRLHPG